ncbi:MAG TPA: YceI family protein [Terriglobales bacterium]
MQPSSDIENSKAEKTTSRFAIDPGRSTFMVQAFSTGFLSVLGHYPRIAVRDIRGEVQLASTGSALEDVRVDVVINPRSLEVVDDISDKDRQEIHRQMYDEVLEVERYPEITYNFSSPKIDGNGGQYSSVMSGELTLHGETHPFAVPVKVFLMGDTLKASGEFSVSQKQYGIAPVTVAGGAIKLKDEVKCTFNIVARKQA